MSPKWAARSCSSCQTYIYDKNGQISHRVGLPQLRPVGSSLPCGDCAKIPTDAPEKSPRYAIELSELNWRVYSHYCEAKAVGFTAEERADPLVRLHAAIVKAVEDEAERYTSRSAMLELGLAAMTQKVAESV